MFDLIRRVALRPFYCVVCVLAGLAIWPVWLGWVAFGLICGLVVGTFIVTASIRNILESALWTVGILAVSIVVGIFVAPIIAIHTVLFIGAIAGALCWIFCLIPKKELPI
ncbi:MAG: hypothetical protein IJF72_01915 [Clostridia bacterium]|nr:hypothetical protein [Clostridia bacterium]